MSGNSFGAVDYVVFISMLLISSAIGLYFRFSGGRQKTASEFLFADGQMSAVPVAFSLMSSFMSAITLLGLSAENYSYGTMFVIINISYGVCTPIAAYLFMPVFFKLRVTSAYEYLEKRFGKSTRISGSIAYCFQMILYMAVALYAPALALEAVSGMPKLYAVFTVGLVCTFYSTVGGLKAVIFTDVFQSLLMFAAVFSIILVAWIDKGSLTEIWRIADSHGRIDFGNIDLDPTVRHSWWSLIIGGGVTFLSVYAVNQGQIQRYMSAGKLETAQKSLWVNLPILILLSFSTSFAGLAIFSKYAGCDPFKSCRITQPDQLMPFYVVDTMRHIPGLSGLFVSGIFSAALSTISAAINSLAAVTLEDYIQPLYKHLKGQDFPAKGSLSAKLISVAYGLVCIALAFIADQLGGVLQASLTILGVVGGPTLGLFSLGMFFPFANQIGALSGFYVSLVFTFWLGFSEKPAPIRLPVSIESCAESSFGNFSLISAKCFVDTHSKRPEEYFYLFRFSYLWLCVLGLTVCLVTGMFVSLIANALSRKSVRQTDPSMFVPPIASYLQRRHCIYNVNRLPKIEQVGDLAMKRMEASGEEATRLCPVIFDFDP